MEACGQMEHPLGNTLFHMVHSVAFYLEQYLMDKDNEYNLPKLAWPKWMKEIDDRIKKEGKKNAS
jgi:hypothetical protein